MIGACKRCGEAFMPKRLAQVYCSRRCRVANAVARHRSDYMEANPSRIPEKRLQAVTPARGPLSDGSTMVYTRGTNTRTAPLPAPSKATTISLSITRTAIPSCRLVWTVGPSR